MDLALAWLAFPLILLVLAGGCGLFVDRICGGRLPGPLLPGFGLAAIIVAGGFTTIADASAEATIPVAVVLALLGYWLGRERVRALRPDGWIVAAGLGVFFIYAAPVVLSGDATFAGYIKLDDTATWMALTDRVMEHGRNLDGLAPSSYEATLSFNLADGYPIGAFIPLGVGAKLSGQDVAWVVQPYMALLAGMLTLVLAELLRPLVTRAWLRAAVAFIAAQPALLLGYALWGGVKEVLAALLVALVAALLANGLAGRGGGSGATADSPGAVEGRLGRLLGYRHTKSPTELWPAAIASAALLGVLSPGGAIWLALPLLAAVVVLLRTRGRQAIRPIAAFLATLALLCIPLVSGGRLLPPTSSPLTSDTAKGNLAESLDPLQVVGIWPEGDFRFAPDEQAATYALIVAALGLALLGVFFAWRSRAPGLLLYAGGAIAGFALICAVGSPWVAAKAMATASPAVLALALGGGAALVLRGRRLEGGIALAALTAGVLWSNALAYHDVRLAPREQLAELERIGELIDHRGPALMTEYQPYGVRHFLRDADPEGVSELRRSPISLRSGRTAGKGEWVDTDRIELDSLLAYETLVLRRSPEQSSPPDPYRRVFEGDYYEVWEKGDGSNPTGLLPLGDGLDPGAVPRCRRVRELARSVGKDGRLVAAPAPATIVVEPNDGELPDQWARAGGRGFTLGDSGSATFAVDVGTEGRYGVWLAGSAQGRLEASIDGEPVGEARHQLENEGLYIGLGDVELGPPGRHELTLSYGAGGLAPGSGGPAPSVGPLVLAGPAVGPGRETAAHDWRSLCGTRWDWIEAFRTDR